MKNFLLNMISDGSEVSVNKICSKCNIEKTLNSENFARDRYSKSGFSFRCKICINTEKRKIRKIKIQNHDYRKNLNNNKKAYRINTLLGKASYLLGQYKSYDKAKSMEYNLTREWFIENILKKECYYCKTKEQLGADRIDNSKGHSIDNVLPCCAVCNTVRNDIFTTEEMLIIGNSIKELRLKRNILKTSIGNKSDKRK